MADVADIARLAAVEATGLLDTGPEESFDRLAALACRLLGVPHAFVTIVDSTRSFWKSCIGVPTTDVADRQNSIEESFCQYVIRSEEPLIVPDARLDEITRDNPSIEKMGVVAWAGLPLRSIDGQVLGTFCIVDLVPREWDAGQIETLTVLSAAIETEIRLRTMLDAADETAIAVRREMNDRERMLSLADALVDADTAGAVAAAITLHGPAAAHGEFATVGVIDTEHRNLELHTPDSLDDDLTTMYRSLPLDAVTPLTDAARNDRPVFLADHAAHHPVYDHLLAAATQASLTATASIPLHRADGTTLGAIGFGWSAPQTFDRGLRATLNTVALMAAQALERAQIGDLRNHLVRTLQGLLLPPVPPLIGVQAVVRYLPANHGLGFGGDWYDVIALDDDRVAIVIGDVVGHGIEAAANMSRVSAAINALTRLHVDDLPQVFAAAEAMLGGGRDAYIATIAIYVLDPRTGDLTFVSAGHPPGIVVRADSTTETLEGGRRPLLGLGGRLPAVGSERLRPGDVLIAYTDGLVEDRRMTLDAGMQRLADSAADAIAAMPLEPAADRIIANMLTGRTVSDDVAFVAVQTARLVGACGEPASPHPTPDR